MRILSLGPLPQEVEEKLCQFGTVHLVDRGDGLSISAMRELLADKEVVLSEPQDKLNEETLGQNTSLKFIAQKAVGFDNIDLGFVGKKNILVTNTPGILSNATADLAFSLLLAVARNICQADTYVRQGKWKGFESNLMLGSEISGKTIGIIGLGRIGLAMARRAHGFGMRILYTRNAVNLKEEENPQLDEKDSQLAKEIAATRVSFKQLLTQSDFISLHCPLTPSTNKLLGEAEFARMKDGCYLINTARGKVVDETALIKYLQAGKFGGLGLDVFEQEPHVPRALIEAPNVVLAPHIGSASRETRLAMANMAADSILEAFQGRLPAHALNKEIWPQWIAANG